MGAFLTYFQKPQDLAPRREIVKKGYVQLLTYPSITSKSMFKLTNLSYPQVLWHHGWSSHLSHQDGSYNQELARILLRMIAASNLKHISYSIMSGIPSEIRHISSIGSFGNLYGLTREYNQGNGVGRLPRTYILTFRGPIQIPEHASEINSLQESIPGYSDAKIHRGGFSLFTTADLETLSNLLIEGDYLFIAGYGQIGASLSILNGLLLNKNVKRVIYTYANGRVGNFSLNTAITDHPNIQNWWSVQNHTDPFTLIPPSIYVPGDEYRYSNVNECYYDVPLNIKYINIQTGKNMNNHQISTYLHGLGDYSLETLYMRAM